MDAERLREFLLALPHVHESEQWGGLVFWAGEKHGGGKMFCVLQPEAPRSQVVSFAAGEELAAELLEREDVSPAPYLARAHWVAVGNWGVFSGRVWEQHLRHAYDITRGKMPRRTRERLGLASVEDA